MAMMVSGSVKFNGVDDSELAKALEFKAKHESSLQFDPSQMVKSRTAAPLYDNMEISWATNDAYADAHELITIMIGK
jgi:hypothetical protein